MVSFKIKMLTLCALFLANVSVFAFDTETHALITREAVARSHLGDGSVQARLLLDRADKNNIFNLFWVSDQNGQIPRYYKDPYYETLYPEDFERCQMQEFLLPQTPPLFQIFGDTVSTYTGLSYLLDNKLPLANWIVRGAIREDDLGGSAAGNVGELTHCGAEQLASSQGVVARSLNHFYNPYDDSALHICFDPYVGDVCHKAVDWALGYISYSDYPNSDSAPNMLSDNFFSYSFAREAFWNAMTRESSKTASAYTYAEKEVDAEDRMLLWATTFRALGNVVHLLEDMGQPQHTRNDAHGGPFVKSLERLAFEDFTNDRVLGVTDESNGYVRGFFTDISNNFPPPPLGIYDPVNFTIPARYFSTRIDGSTQSNRGGLSDYSNRGFFTGGTLPGETSMPFPPSVDTSYSVVVVPCEDLATADPRLQSVTCTHYTHMVPDPIEPTYADELPCNQNVDPPVCFDQPPLLSESIFKRVISYVNDAEGNSSVSVFVSEYALGIAEMETIGNMTIPRAVGYVSGFINFFFRGELAVSAPADGVYSVINHGTPHTVDADGIPHPSGGGDTSKAFGFESVRLQVKNTTEDLVDSAFHTSVPQGTGGPGAKLVAVAHYHRNPCYQPTLTGEVGEDYLGVIHQPSIDCPSNRTSLPEISVSNYETVAQGQLDVGDGDLITFDFSQDPIPVNATDLFFQVAYRGQLGNEGDGIAVGSVDVSEPMYFVDYNLSDYEYTSNDSWIVWPSVPPPPSLDLDSVEICFDDWKVFDTAPGEDLPANHIVRLALIGDFGSHTWSGTIRYQGIFSGSSSYWTGPWGGTMRQAYDEIGDGYYTSPLGFARGFNGGDAGYPSAFNYFGPTPFITSPWGEVSDITTPSIGLASENIGTVIQPGVVSCGSASPSMTNSTNRYGLKRSWKSRGVGFIGS